MPGSAPCRPASHASAPAPSSPCDAFRFKGPESTRSQGSGTRHGAIPGRPTGSSMSPSSKHAAREACFCVRPRPATSSFRGTSPASPPSRRTSVTFFWLRRVRSTRSQRTPSGGRLASRVPGQRSGRATTSTPAAISVPSSRTTGGGLYAGARTSTGAGPGRPRGPAPRSKGACSTSSRPTRRRSSRARRTPRSRSSRSCVTRGTSPTPRRLSPRKVSACPLTRSRSFKPRSRTSTPAPSARTSSACRTSSAVSPGFVHRLSTA